MHSSPSAIPSHDAPAGTAARLLRSGWPAIALAAVLVIANWPLVSGRECPPFDAYSTFGIYHHMVGAFARAGRFLTWNPWFNAGSPDFADPQVGAYSPFVLATAFLANGAEVGFRVYWLLIWYLGGLGMIVLGRHLGAQRWGCFAVATGYAFSGFYTGHAEHTVATYAFSGLPWTIWRADVAMRHRRFGDAAQAGALLGLSALGGYPGVVICNAAYTAMWTLGRALTGRRELIPSVARWTSVMSIIAMVFGLVAAATYVPFFVDAAGYSGRTGPLPRDIAVYSGAYRPWALTTFASPAIAPLDFEREPDPSLRSVYLGTLIPALALIALVRPVRRRSAAARAGLGFGALAAKYGIGPWRWWLAGLAAVSLMCALSMIFPLRGWLYDFVFPFRYFRQASLFRAYVMFSVTVLALYGCRDVAARLRRRKPSIGAMVLIALPALLALPVAHIAFSAQHGLGEAVRVHVLVMWLLPVVVAIAAATLARTRRRDTLIVAAIMIVASVDAVWSAAISGPLLHATNDLWYRSSDLRYQDIDLTRRGLARQVESLDNNNLWHKIPVLRSYTPFQNAWFERLSRHPVFERAATQPDRIFFTTQVTRARSMDEHEFTAMLDRATQLNAPIVLIDAGADEPAGLSISESPAATPIAVHLDRYLPDELTFTTTTPSAGWLLVTDRWARGWRVTVNGYQRALYKGDFVFRAVPVPAGHVQVRFVYETTYGLTWVALSWATLAWCLIIIPIIRARLPRRPPAHA
jgi:hypothetical protein